METALVRHWSEVLLGLRRQRKVFLPIFTIYRYPADFPDKYVVRLSDTGRPTKWAMLANSEEEAVSYIPAGFTRLTRNREDEPQIVATYV